MVLAGGSLIFGAFLVLYTLVVVYSLYTRRGSGINQRPFVNVYDPARGATRDSRLAHDSEGFDRYSRGTR
jgi:hypothetical protein